MSFLWRLRSIGLCVRFAGLTVARRVHGSMIARLVTMQKSSGRSSGSEG